MERAKREHQKTISVVFATRHVLTTTVTTMMGFVPLLAAGDPFWQPLAIAIAGGIAGSSVMALYVEELFARIRVHLRRTQNEETDTLQFGDFARNSTTWEVYRGLRLE